MVLQPQFTVDYCASWLVNLVLIERASRSPCNYIPRSRTYRENIRAPYYHRFQLLSPYTALLFDVPIADSRISCPLLSVNHALRIRTVSEPLSPSTRFNALTHLPEKRPRSQRGRQPRHPRSRRWSMPRESRGLLYTHSLLSFTLPLSSYGMPSYLRLLHAVLQHHGFHLNGR